MIQLLVNLSKVALRTCFPIPVIFALTFGGCATFHSSFDREDLLEIASDVDQPPTAKTLYAMSRILMSQGREDQGESVLLKLIAEYPRFIPAYCDLAEYRLRQGRFDDAVEELSKGLRMAPEDPILLNNAGVCSLLRGDCEAALSNFSMAAEVMPREERYRANMALALGMMGRYDESLKLYKEVLPAKDAAHNLNVIRNMGTWNTILSHLERGVRTLAAGAEAEQERTEGTEDISQ